MPDDLTKRTDFGRNTRGLEAVVRLLHLFRGFGQISLEYVVAELRRTDERIRCRCLSRGLGCWWRRCRALLREDTGGRESRHRENDYCSSHDAAPLLQSLKSEV